VAFAAVRLSPPLPAWRTVFGGVQRRHPPVQSGYFAPSKACAVPTVTISAVIKAAAAVESRLQSSTPYVHFQPDLVLGCFRNMGADAALQ